MGLLKRKWKCLKGSLCWSFWLNKVFLFYAPKQLKLCSLTRTIKCVRCTLFSKYWKQNERYADVSDYFLVCVKIEKKRNIWVENGRTDQWWNDIMLGGDIPDQWWKKIRMKKESFLKLADEIRDLRSIPIHKYTELSTFYHQKNNLAITLYYPKDKGSLWMTANTFGVHACTVSKTVPIVMRRYKQNNWTKISSTSFDRGGNEDKMRPIWN